MVFTQPGRLVPVLLASAIGALTCIAQPAHAQIGAAPPAVEDQLEALNSGHLLPGGTAGQASFDLGVAANVTDLAIDSQGFGWFTTDLGIGRMSRSGIELFDDVLSSDLSFSHEASSIAAHQTTGVWLATGMLVHLDPWTRRMTSTGIAAEYIAPAEEGLWLVNRQTVQFFSFSDEAVGETIDLPPTLHDDVSFALAVDDDGNLYVADSRHLLTVTRAGRVWDKQIPGGATSIQPRLDGGVWAVGAAGLWTLPSPGALPMLVSKLPNDMEATSVVQLDPDRVLVGTTTGEILVRAVDEERWLGSYNAPFRDAAITQMLAGDDEDLWFTQSGALATHVSRRSGLVDFVPFPEGESTFVPIVAASNESSVFVGSSANQIWEYDPQAHEWAKSRGSINTLLQPEATLDELAASGQWIWAATRGQPMVVATLDDSQPPRSFDMNTATATLTDPVEGEIYIASSLPAIIVDSVEGGRRASNDLRTIGFDEQIRSLQVSQQYIFAGSLGFVIVLDKETLEVVKVLRAPGELDELAVDVMTVDLDGILWVAARSSLIRFDIEAGTHTSYGIDAGLSGSRIASMALTARNDGLWLATSTGIELFDFDQRGVSTVLGVFDGLDSSDFEPVPALSLDDGSRLFVTSTGLARIPGQRAESLRSPVSRVFADCASGCGEQFDGRTVTGSDAVRMRILIPISVGALSRAEYRLRGLESEWHAAGASTTISYQNLGEGPYVFEARILNASGEVLAETIGGPGGSIRVVNPRPFYEREVVRVAAVLMLVGLSVAYFLWYKRQARLRQAHLEWVIAERTRDAEDARRVAERANESKSEFLAAVTHDLRSPLTTILGYADLATLRTDGPVAEYVANIATAGTHLSSLIDDLVDVAQETPAPSTPTDDCVDLEEALSDVKSMLGLAASQNGISLGVELECPSRLRLKLEQASVSRVLVNFVANAINHSGGTAVVMRIEWDDPSSSDTIRISVTDDGGSMPPDQLEFLRGRFRRGADATSDGMGLGISIVESLVAPFGTTVQIDVDPGVQTTFSVTVPCADNGPATNLTTHHQVLTVWVVDDEPHVVDVVVSMLKERGFVVEGFESPETALAKLATAAPNCVVTDIGMAPMDGIEFAQRLRNHAGSAIWIVAMTGLPERVDANPLFDLVLAKPMKPEQVWAAVEFATPTD